MSETSPTHGAPSLLQVSRSEVETYAQMFVNQPCYAQMTNEVGERSTYFQPRGQDKMPARLTIRTLHSHLLGSTTLMFYAINPSNQMAKWLCMDADHPSSAADLERIKDKLAFDGIGSVYENSRRGGHLWVFFSEPILASSIRRYILHVLSSESIPLARGDKPGIEVYPRQDSVTPSGFGNGVRGPLGVHRKDGLRYWFHGAPTNLNSQLAMLRELPTLTPGHLNSLLDGIPRSTHVMPAHPRRSDTRAFSIFDYYPKLRTHGRYEVQCPSCQHLHLAITVGGPKDGYYICFNGCKTPEIRAALGQPVLQRYSRAA